MSNPFQARLLATLPASDSERLDRILLRASADLDHVLETIGTGAPITVKRATALRVAMDGDDVAAIASVAGLSEARVSQVLENVLAAGLSALYPSFAEVVPLPEPMSKQQLWDTIWPLIRTTPSDNGVRVPVWNPALVVDYLVHTGTLPDTSIGAIAELIRINIDPEKKPVTFEETDDSHLQGKPIGISGALLFLVVGIGLAVLGIWQKQVSLLIFSIVAVPLAGIQVVRKLLEKRLLRSVVVKNTIPDAAGMEAAKPVKRADAGSPPKATILHALSLPAVPQDLERISDSCNALQQTPVRTLYLWVFAAQSDQGGFETEGWPQLGPVHLLLNSTALSVSQLARAPEKLLVADQTTLDRTVSEYSDAAGTYDRPSLFFDGALGKRVYRGYPIHTLVCNDLVWKPAVHQLAARCDLAVVNLSGYNPSHPGLEYEIRHLLSGGPPSRFVFVYERTTDADAVISGVLDLWSQLDTVPAGIPELLFLRIPDSQDVGYQMQFQKAIRGTGWLANVYLKREGEYMPIAPRIVSYLERLESSEAGS